VDAISQIDAASILFTQAMRTPSASPMGSPATLAAWQARRIVDYIDQNITEPLRVSNLCALVHRTESHFSRLFKRTFAVSPHAYILNRRLELALQLIAESDMPLSQVALRCGFGDQAHLSNRFRRRNGVTPSAWRQAFLSQYRTLRSNSAIPASK
jgi:AraC family transcriptional regulator